MWERNSAMSNLGCGITRVPSIALLNSLYSSFLSFSLLIFYIRSNVFTFAAFIRGQSPARQTKVVDHGLGPVKAGQTRLCVPVCVNDASSSKPTSVGRDVVDGHTQTNSVGCVVDCVVDCEVGCVVGVCGSVRCKTCVHMSQGNTFMSNVTQKCYKVINHSGSLTCGTDNLIYLISCKRCGIQYVGETGQTLRKRLNNHRNRLKYMTNLYLYHHFNSDGHSEKDISIKPIEKIISDSSAYRLEREDYWCRELCTLYPYGLNDNVRKFGNISKCKDEIIVNTLFNKQNRKFRKRQQRKRKSKRDLNKLTICLENLLTEYKSDS